MERTPPRIAVCVAALLAGGCGETPAPPDGAAEGAEGAAESGPALAARYLNTYAFAAGTPGTPHLYAELRNETSPAYLIRDYRAWRVEASGPRPLLALRDTLPVPRAAWRVLPGQGLRVLVADGGETLALELADGARALRLLPGAPIAEWTGATGQREYVAPAALTEGEDGAPGLLFFRRAARPGGVEPGAGADRVFVLADSSGGGLLVAGPTEERGGLLTAWTWLDDEAATWTAVALTEEADGAEARPGERTWRLELPEAEIEGTLRTADTEEALPPPGPPGPGRPSIRPIRADLVVQGDTVRLRGLFLQAVLP